MSIEKMMCLSTGHVAEETAKQINLHLEFEGKEDWERPDEAQGLPEWLDKLIIYPHGEYGWLMCIGGDVVDHVDLVQDEIPEELYGCMKHAHAHDCEWLLLDQDADLIDELPSFDW